MVGPSHIVKLVVGMEDLSVMLVECIEMVDGNIMNVIVEFSDFGLLN